MSLHPWLIRKPARVSGGPLASRTNNKFRSFYVSQTCPPYVNDHDGYVYVSHYEPLTIYDGSNDQSTQIAKLSGYLGSFNISSSGNALFVKFEADNYGYAGFHAITQHGIPYFNIEFY